MQWILNVGYLSGTAERIVFACSRLESEMSGTQGSCSRSGAACQGAGGESSVQCSSSAGVFAALQEEG